MDINENSVNDEQLEIEGQQDTREQEPESPNEGESAGDAGRQRAEQDHRFNAAMKAARQRAEKETAERITRETDSKITGMRIPNPDKPGSYFSSLAELESYSRALRKANLETRAKKEGRSAAELEEEDANREYLSRKRAEDERADKEAREKKKREEWIAADAADFMSRHPDIDIEKLDNNKQFRRFAGSRYGKEPLADLYEDFVELSGDVAKSAVLRQDGRSERSTGSGDGKGSGPLTAAQRQELKEWNDNNPDMRMTESEFRSR